MTQKALTYIVENIIRAFINNPITPILLIACLILGLIGLHFTPRQKEPQILPPIIDVFIQYPGVSAQQIEILVTQPIERVIKEIPEIKHIYSTTMRGAVTVTIQFQVGTNMQESITKIHDKIETNLDKIPSDVQITQIKPISIDDVPLITVTLWSKTQNDSQLRALAQEMLQELTTIPNTGNGFVVGGRHDQIRIEVLIERLAGYGITLDRIANTIRSANSELIAGNTEFGGTVYNVHSGTFLRTETDIAKLIVGTQGKQPIYIADVAQVSHIPEDTRQIVMHYTGAAYTGAHHANGEQAVTVAIAKKASTNGISVAAAILDKIQQLKSKIIPDTVQIEIIRNYAATANDKINELLWAILEIFIIISILCFIGLGLQTTIIVIIVTLIVILMTIWWVMVTGYSIDRINLIAIIATISIAVDNTIIIIVNISRHWLLTKQVSIETTINAIKEIANPTIFATIILIFALLPITLISDTMGIYLKPIPIFSISAIIFSLLATFILTPWLILKITKPNTDTVPHFIPKLYPYIIHKLIHIRQLNTIFLITNIIAIFIPCALLCYTQIIPIKILPHDNRSDFSIIINMPEGTALPETANAIHQIAKKLQSLSTVTTIQSYIATAQPFNDNSIIRQYYLRDKSWQGDLLVSLIKENARTQNSHTIATQVRQLLTPLARQLGVKIAIIETPPGPPMMQTLVAEIYGPDAQTRRQVAADITTLFSQSHNIVDVDNDIASPYYYWQFQIDTEKAIRRGISINTINQNLAMIMGGYKLGDVKHKKTLEPVYIILQAPLAQRSNLTTLTTLPIPTSNGKTIPLGELGQFTLQLEDPIVHRLDLRPVEYVTGEMIGYSNAPIYGIMTIENELKNYITPDGLRISGIPAGLITSPQNTSVTSLAWSGEWTTTYTTFRDTGLAFIIALLLAYGLLVWRYTDILLATLIMAPIPLTIATAVIGHWLVNVQFTAISMLGLIALSGNIIRQSSLIVEIIKLELVKGANIVEAVIAAAEIRMFPTLITTLISAGGAWILMSEPIFQGMVSTLFIGTLTGTALTLIIIPLGYMKLKHNLDVYANADVTMIWPNNFIHIKITANAITTAFINLLWVHLWNQGKIIITKFITTVIYLWYKTKARENEVAAVAPLAPQIKDALAQDEHDIQIQIPEAISSNENINTNDTTSKATRRKTKTHKMHGIRLRDNNIK